jgi:asparagine synthase (glutamine-hydrolysing)
MGITLNTPSIDYRRKILKDAKSLYPGEPLRQAMFLDQHTFLQSLLTRNDRMTMGASIECRVPFLDHRLVEGLASLPSTAFIRRRKSKFLLRSNFAPQLPQPVLTHRKIGFGVPWDEYMREPEAFGSQLDRLASSHIVDSLPVSAKSIRAMTRNFFEGDNQYYLFLYQLLMTDIWQRGI